MPEKRDWDTSFSFKQTETVYKVTFLCTNMKNQSLEYFPVSVHLASSVSPVKSHYLSIPKH